MNCGEKVRTGVGNILLSLASACVSLFLLIGAVICFTGEDMTGGAILSAAAVVASPIVGKILRNLMPGKLKLRKFFSFLRFVAVIVLTVAWSFSGSAGNNTTPEKKTVTTPEAYQMLVNEATAGNYLNGWRIYQKCPSLSEYQDAKNYYDYCVAMRAYQAGAIGYAYNLLLTVPNTLDANTYLNSISNEIGSLNGVYKEDNGVGSYLYLVIENGRVLMDVVPYSQASSTFTYNMSESYDTIIKGKYTDGTTYYAVGTYSEIGAKVKSEYVMNIFKDKNEIMLIRNEGNELSTFNGLYAKVG